MPLLAGGFLSSKFLETDVKDVVLDTGSKRKYSSVIRNFGGWGNLQKLLKVLDSIGKKHDQSIANVATRWVLEKESVLAVILGATETIFTSKIIKSCSNLRSTRKIKVKSTKFCPPRPKQPATATIGNEEESGNF